MPKRGPNTSHGHVYVVLAMPWPDRKMPLVELPVPGTTAPMASVEFGPRNWPVSGFFA